MTDHTMETIGDRKFALKRLEGIAWGLFFVWVGVVLLEEFSWGIGLLGVGILVLGAQMARKRIAAGFETFWLVVGTLFLLGGIWALLNVRISLLPIVCILAGAGLLASALAGKAKPGQQS